jgi:3-hydroxyisobutyrate dehydrogenase
MVALRRRAGLRTRRGLRNDRRSPPRRSIREALDANAERLNSGRVDEMSHRSASGIDSRPSPERGEVAPPARLDYHGRETETIMSAPSDVRRIGFIGTGVMGRSMALHLIRAGHRLAVHNRTKAKAKDLLDAGASWADLPAEAARDADLVITMVGFPADVRDVYLGSGAIVASARPGAILVDMTTSEPSLAREVDEAARARGLSALDAPVSGGDVGARNATLSIMVGGERVAFEAALPILRLLGKTVVHQGPAGAGQHTKMCNQITIASNMIGVMEALLYARRSGLDPERVLESIGSGAAASWSLSNLQPRVLRGDFAPGFFVRHFLKDIRIAIAESERLGIATPGLRLARELYEKVVEMGGESLGTQAIYKALEAMSRT